ncbi:hypothetical protein LINPERHAP2_LOCUS37538 [Linum perenne]
MPSEYKDNKWSLIEDFKATVKAAWFEDNIRDERVCHEDWKWLLKFWNSSKAAERRVVAKRARNKLSSSHTMGTKSCARVRHEMRSTAPGNKEPSRADVYIATHVRHDGKPLNEKVGGYIEKMKEIQTHMPTSCDDHGPNDIYSQVLGADKPNSCRTYGLGSMGGGGGGGG